MRLVKSPSVPGTTLKRWSMALISTLVLSLALWAVPTHTITATLNYDFSVDNACSTTVTTGCLLQFNVYDLTSGTPVKLFSIPAPAGANAPVTGITGTSSAIPLKSGVHLFGVTAQMADGTESDPNASTATATAKPGAPVNFAVSVK